VCYEFTYVQLNTAFTLLPINKGYIFLSFLREPYFQLLSAISHDIKAKYNKPNNCKNLQEFIHGDCTHVYSPYNPQTQRLANGNIKNATSIIDSLFWFGITEHYHTSLCLLAFQLHQFSKEKCDCSIQNNANVMKYLPQKRNVNPKREIVKTREQDEWIANHTYYDNLLYKHALAIFYERVQFVEMETNTTILCLMSNVMII
jgi:hypothetical protein